MKLNAARLDALPETILRPRYDRAALCAGIVHIGVGNFHRGHQAWYLHRLMQQGLAHDWAIIGAGVRATDAAMRDKLLAQDCLTTLIELSPDIHKNLQRGAIVRATLSLGDAFGMCVLAEGVETIEELNFLKAEGCLCVQGYFFSKPMNTAAIRELTMVEHIEMAS